MNLRGKYLASLLLLLALAGCQTGPPVQTAAPDSQTDNVRRLPPVTRELSSPESPILLASFEEDDTELESHEELVPAPVPLVTNPANSKLLSLADLESIATRNNPTLSAALARMEAARGKQLQAGLYPNPMLGYHAMEIGNLGTVGQQGAFASQQFITGGKLGLDQAIAGKEIDEAHFRFHAQEQRVLSDVRIRFYDALVAQRRIELTQELARLGDQLESASEQLLENRIGTENDLLQAQIRADEAQILLQNAQNFKSEAWKRLSAVVGVADLSPQPLDGKLDADLPAYEWEECTALVLDANPELAAARTRVERASIALRRAQKEPIPNVDLMVSVRHQNITSYDVANVQLGMPIPVFNKNQGNIRSADAEWIVANREVERVELDLQDRLAVAYRRYTNARQQVTLYRDRILPRASKSLELVTAGYDRGQVEYLTLLTAQQTYIQVNLSYLDSLRELRTSAAVIEGQLLADSLSSR